jgi:hypothetical protein
MASPPECYRKKPGGSEIIKLASAPWVRLLFREITLRATINARFTRSKQSERKPMTLNQRSRTIGKDDHF